MGHLGNKPFGKDTQTDLDKEVQIVEINIDAKTETIKVTYEIVLLDLKGKPVKVLENKFFTRTGNKYTDLKSSAIGQGILGLLQLDLANIKGLETIEEDLKQL